MRGIYFLSADLDFSSTLASQSLNAFSYAFAETGLSVVLAYL